MSENEEKKGSETAPSVTDSPEYKELLAERDRMKAKLDELLAETKRAKAEKRAAEDAAAEEARQKAEQENDYKQLYESSKAAEATAKQELDALRAEIADGRLSSFADKIAGELTRDTARAELLAEKIKARLKEVDGAIQVTDSAGVLSAAGTDGLKTEFAEKYAFLVDGSQASGGGAQGGDTGGGTKPLSKMTESERIAFAERDPDGFKTAINAMR